MPFPYCVSCVFGILCSIQLSSNTERYFYYECLNLTELNLTVEYTECVTWGDHNENVEPQGKNVFDFASDIECCQESSILLFFCCQFFYCCRSASVDVASCQSSLWLVSTSFLNRMRYSNRALPTPGPRTGTSLWAICYRAAQNE